MSSKAGRTTLATLCLTVGLAACGNGPATCLPGAVVACTCLGGVQSTQTCGTTGAYGECDCATPDAGTHDAGRPTTHDAGPVDAGPVDAGVVIDAGTPCVDAGTTKCTTNRNCPTGFVCLSGACYNFCRVDLDCVPPSVCNVDAGACYFKCE